MENVKRKFDGIGIGRPLVNSGGFNIILPLYVKEVITDCEELNKYIKQHLDIAFKDATSRMFRRQEFKGTIDYTVYNNTSIITRYKDKGYYKEADCITFRYSGDAVTPNTLRSVLRKVRSLMYESIKALKPLDYKPKKRKVTHIYSLMD